MYYTSITSVILTNVRMQFLCYVQTELDHLSLNMAMERAEIENKIFLRSAFEAPKNVAYMENLFRYCI